jgi:hypothetical protein
MPLPEQRQLAAIGEGVGAGCPFQRPAELQLSEQVEPRPTEALVPTSPNEPERRQRAIDDAWEAVVRQELARIRRRNARERRFTRREDQA